MKVNKNAVQDPVQDVQDWLEQVRKLDELINAKLAERDQVMDLATGVSSEMDGMPHASGKSDKVGNAAVKLADLATEIDRLIDMYVDFKRDVVAALEKLPANEYGVLHRYYIRYMTWEEIAQDMGYCTVQVWRYKVKGLKRLADVIECYTIPVV